MSKLAKFFKVQANAGNDLPAQISVRGEIGNYFDGETWTVKDSESDVLAEMAAIPAGKKIEVHVNSQGGNLQCALGMRNAFRARAADTTFINAGFMCSAAAILAPKGSKIICPTGSLVMIHKPKADIGAADEDDAVSACNALKAVTDSYASCVAETTGKTLEQARKLLKPETWWTHEQALAEGFASSNGVEPAPMDSDFQAVASRVVALYGKTLPENLRARIKASAPAEIPPPTPKPQPTKVSMKKITAALVAAGFAAATNAETEDAVLPFIQSIVAERDRMATENKAHVEARKTRVTSAVEAAVTEKILADGRKASLVAFGAASPEGEAEVTAQLSDLRAAKVEAGREGRGARAAKPGAGNEQPTIEDIRAEMADPETTPSRRAALAVQCRKMRGHEKLFASAEKN